MGIFKSKAPAAAKSSHNCRANLQWQSIGHCRDEHGKNWKTVIEDCTVCGRRFCRDEPA